ncbi:D-alanyl-D-alanine carboxypeptidase family protein [Methylogaea oryzae]|uniref:D-alanyl-D-alanine carboxypeptidase family protein n=1 Tax=Methylogaea oryzae TaxID=1295382 RepID=UPI001C7F1435|nr:D-alanyl-D-alanine carboxypeptidase family protein [Methylogaea oryzae]
MALILLGTGLLLPVPSALAAPNYQAALVVDAESAGVLYEKDGGALWFPASLTKMMTVYLTFDAMAKGKLAPTDMLQASPHAASQRGTTLGLKAGDKLSVDTAIRSLIVRSANDVAVVLAERVGGTESAFATLMTDTARQLGMAHTIYRNATGLPNMEQVTTARDMAILARALLTRFANYYPYFSGRSVNYKGRELPSYNGLLSSYVGADGMKTGFTCAAGFNIVASAKRAGRRLIGVLLGSTSRVERAGTISYLLNQGFAAQSAAARPNLYELFKNTAMTLLKRPQPLDVDACNSDGADNGATTAQSAAPSQPQQAQAPSQHFNGWGAVIGEFRAADEPGVVLEKFKARWPGDLANGRARVVTHLGQGAAGHNLVITGITKDQASAICSRQAWPSRAHCVTVNPTANIRGISVAGGARKTAVIGAP